ncbi:MAG: class I SAM-dependent methyltransferase [bacterium]|nr:class I SAM-dependent methyltransferase [bacterium]
MNPTLEYLIQKFNLDINTRPPIEVGQINRTIMTKTLGELGFRVGAEVGVAQGHHAKVICENNPQILLYAIDIWDLYPGYEEYSDRIRKYYQEAQERLALYNCKLVKKFSMAAVEDFADNSLDFVYIDGAHDYKNVAMDICEWSKKVKVGGIVFGHDYKRSRGKYRVDVKDVVPSFCYAKEVRPWFVLKNDIKDPLFGQDNPGWMFVRQETDRT